MCGIAGVVSATRESTITEALVHHMCQTDRVSDDEGIHVADGAGRRSVRWCVRESLRSGVSRPRFRVQFRLRKIGETKSGSSNDSQSGSPVPELAYLAGIEVTGRAQESSREVEGGVEAELAEHGRGGDKVGLATIVIGDTNARLGRIEKSFAEILTPSRLPPVLHRSLKLLRG